MAGAATCVMVESSRSITAAAITTANASHRPRDPVRPACSVLTATLTATGACVWTADDIRSSCVLSERNLLFQYYQNGMLRSSPLLHFFHDRAPAGNRDEARDDDKAGTPAPRRPAQRPPGRGRPQRPAHP